jgi:hypothetical protein
MNEVQLNGTSEKKETLCIGLFSVLVQTIHTLRISSSSVVEVRS